MCERQLDRGLIKYGTDQETDSFRRQMRAARESGSGGGPAASGRPDGSECATRLARHMHSFKTLLSVRGSPGPGQRTWQDPAEAQMGKPILAEFQALSEQFARLGAGPAGLGSGGGSSRVALEGAADPGRQLLRGGERQAADGG